MQKLHKSEDTCTVYKYLTQSS